MLLRNTYNPCASFVFCFITIYLSIYSFIFIYSFNKISMVEQGVVEIISNLADSYQEVRIHI